MKNLFIIDTLSGQRNGQKDLIGKFVDATPEFIAETMFELWANQAGDNGNAERLEEEVGATYYYHDIHHVRLYTAREAMKLGFDAKALRDAWEFFDNPYGRVKLNDNAYSGE